ncbi:MAG: hypothetical protein QT12_C0028G0003 [archaeon GW2011_AR21]|uniref:Uncharacterized protein n=1 Tax=Candidatus Iainarchaeum sp. TaxID=3101447 RepID=A0A7J4JZ14_9ARCH|nr:MAG: hypothetical protein QT12_C0028G0003 [archaeon GW2011_AR21]HIH21505.1 hypothetical protein [Candidatus Diapherotrites archaeon]
MALTKADSDKIIAFVKKEPCLVQDLSRHIGKSWVTTEAYVQKIAKDTGLIRVKAFREGTRGAVKIVFWDYSESLQADEAKSRIFEKIKLLSGKKEFDPFEIFQFVPPSKGKAYMEYYDDPAITSAKFVPFLRSAHEELLCFSGNISFINVVEGKTLVLDVVKELLERGVSIKIICRIDIASMHNMDKISSLLKKFPKQLEIRHSAQPLRGFIIDGKKARLKDEKSRSDFKGKELDKDARIFYDIYDSDWIEWLERTFWYLFRTSGDFETRMKVLNNLV